MSKSHLRGFITPILAALLLCAACATGGGATGGTPSPTTRSSPTPGVTITPPVNANQTPTIPVGSPAITPTQSGTPAYTEADVRAYLQQHPMMPGAQNAGPFTVASVAFKTSREVSAQLAGESTGYPDAAMLSIVTVQGTFAFPRPPDGSATYHQGFLVFDGATGNLVINGGLRTPGIAGAATSQGTALMSAAQALLRPAQPASNYSCFNPHCYAVAEWDGAPLSSFLDGLSAEITFTQKNGGDGFLDTEMWLVQKNNPACDDGSGQTGPQCWVETGIIADATRGFAAVNHYFWADNRPGAGFMFHDFGPVGALDQNPQTPDGFFITPDGPNTWQIGIVGLQTNSALLFAYSTNNPMTPTLVEYGSELFGTNGAAMAGSARFSDLTYYSGQFGLYMTGNPNHIYPNDNTGPELLNFTESPGSSSSGGIFETTCC